MSVSHLAPVRVEADRGWLYNQPLPVDGRGQPEVSDFTCSYSPIHDHDGRLGGVLRVTQDVARRQVEERARHKGELRALLNDLRAHRSRRRRVTRKG